jgi:hypothetical protein
MKANKDILEKEYRMSRYAHLNAFLQKQPQQFTVIGNISSSGSKKNQSNQNITKERNSLLQQLEESKKRQQQHEQQIDIANGTIKDKTKNAKSGKSKHTNADGCENNNDDDDDDDDDDDIMDADEEDDEDNINAQASDDSSNDDVNDNDNEELANLGLTNTSSDSVFHKDVTVQMNITGKSMTLAKKSEIANQKIKQSKLLFD